jgi:TPR repeat protein
VAQDYAKAREWFEKAADKDSAESMHDLGWLYEHGKGVAQDYAKAREWFEKAADKGDEQAPIVAALLAREFTKALAFADRARSLSPDDLMIESYRAHALMFLERGEEAKALYLAHKGEPVSGQDGELWERVIVGAFLDFREAGLTHPMMAEIEKELGVSP